MMPSLLFVFISLLAIGHCSTIPEQPKTDPSSDVPDVPASTGLPERSTRGPHTHEEHPADDPNHDDHDHVEEPKAAKADEDDHEHPGHDHSETGHDHKLDHPEDHPKENDAKPSPPEGAPKIDEVKEDQESGEKRSKRGLWRRRLD